MFTFCITQLHICHDIHEPLHPSSIPKHKCDHITRSNNLCTANSKQHSGRQGVGDGRRWIIDVQHAGHKQNTRVCTTILVGTFHWHIDCIHLYTLYYQVPTSPQPHARHQKHIRTRALATCGVHARKSPQQLTKSKYTPDACRCTFISSLLLIHSFPFTEWYFSLRHQWFCGDRDRWRDCTGNGSQHKGRNLHVPFTWL